MSETQRPQVRYFMGKTLRLSMVLWDERGDAVEVVYSE